MTRLADCLTNLSLGCFQVLIGFKTLNPALYTLNPKLCKLGLGFEELTVSKVSTWEVMGCQVIAACKWLGLMV